MERCKYCIHSISNGEDCVYCKFKYDENYFPYLDDDWDIFNLNDELEYSHLQILYRLHLHGIECLFADIWHNNNIAVLIGCKSNKKHVSRVLNVNEDCVYIDDLNPLVIINLFQEKFLRGLL